MGIYRDWIGIARRKFIKLEPQKTIIVLHPSDSESFTNEEKVNGSEESFDFKEGYGGGGSGSSFKRKEFSKEGLAAIKIQAFFRGHLARRAYRALRSLVKLQAVVRGVCVRRQARVALHCMHALVRLQVRIRARQLLTRFDDD